MNVEFTAKFSVGQIIQHRLFEYRGVIIDVDPAFHGSNTWYQRNARSTPPREKPWYHVLVDGAELQTYVAERNLLADTEGGPVNHPEVSTHFEKLEDNVYRPRRQQN